MSPVTQLNNYFFWQPLFKRLSVVATINDGLQSLYVYTSTAGGVLALNLMKLPLSFGDR